ncbi:MAG: alpha/beta hydrolase [Patescibacteria group bacterium]|nr:alpha/beta hydrolase [Patescibacteria group bacterium]
MTEDLIKEKYIDTGRGKIFYWLSNSFPGKPTVVFLHGLSSNHTTWMKAMSILHEYKYNSLAWDMRGHGLSDKTKKRNLYELSVFSEDLCDIMKKEKIEKPIMVGYSFGGSVAIDCAIKDSKPLSGLILLGTNHANPMEYNGVGFLTGIGSKFVGLLAFLMLWQNRKEYYYYQHGKAVGYWDSVLDGLRTMPISVNLWLLIQTVSFDFRKTINKIKTPVTFINTKKDIFVTEKEIEDLKNELPNAKFIVSKTDSHFVGTNSQDEVIEIILGFLKTI